MDHWNPRPVWGCCLTPDTIAKALIPYCVSLPTKSCFFGNERRHLRLDPQISSLKGPPDQPNLSTGTKINCCENINLLFYLLSSPLNLSSTSSVRLFCTTKGMCPDCKRTTYWDTATLSLRLLCNQVIYRKSITLCKTYGPLS